MQTATDKLLNGALLGDLIEEITGRDLKIVRYNIVKTHYNDNTLGNCKHQIKAYSKRYLIATANVEWTGKLNKYEEITKGRMRNFLKAYGIKPTHAFIDNRLELLDRIFAFNTDDGYLKIEERIYLKKVELVRIKTTHGQ